MHTIFHSLRKKKVQAQFVPKDFFNFWFATARLHAYYFNSLYISNGVIMVLVLFDPDRFSGQVGRALKNSGFTKNRHWKVQNIVCYVILGVQASVMQIVY